MIIFQDPPSKLANLTQLHRYHIIAAVDQQGGFSKNNEIPWYYPADFQWFKQNTVGCPIIMGRKTYEDINKRLGDKATESVLPGRQCFVLSKSIKELPNATVITSIRQSEYHITDNSKPTFIIGGEKLFLEGIALTSEVYLTIINKTFSCDLFFPTKYLMKHFDKNQLFKSNDPDLAFVRYVRKI